MPANSHYGCRFDDLFKVSRLARISALEYWRDRIRDYDKWDKTHFECTEEQKEAPIGGSRRVQEGMVKALDELAWMAKEVEIDDDDEGGVKV